jgi:energy-coupling factor transporter ATP-binding protein EcfA2
LDQIISFDRFGVEEISFLERNLNLLQQNIASTSLGPDLRSQIDSLVNISHQALDANMKTHILSNLQFKAMSDRFGDVENAHCNTFSWLMGELPFDSDSVPDSQTDSQSESESKSYSESRSAATSENEVSLDESQHKAKSDFESWLRNGKGVFFITGKPGAGKSTLMKYLYLHSETKEHLQAWAGSKRLILANFFFWKPGTKLQSSLKGLLRALLYHILDQLPEFIPVCFPDKWKRARGGIMPPLEQSDIQSAFDILMKNETVYVNRKFVFFIDGLDESDGDHDKMAKLLLEWVESHPSDLKICVSSREWLVFKERFTKYPSIRLHDLTRSDIETFILDTLNSNDSFQALPASTNSQRLIDLITVRAEGVFLWVAIVLRTIEEGLLAEDHIEDLIEKINALPGEIELLYDHIFDSIIKKSHPIDRKYIMQILELVSDPSIGVQLSVLQCSFLQDYDKDREMGFHLYIGDISPEEVQLRKRRCQKKVLSCKGLVQVTEYFRATDIHGIAKPNRYPDLCILAIHRSITEFLRREDIRTQLRLHLNGFDDVHFRIQAIVAELTCAKFEPYDAIGNIVSQLISDISRLRDIWMYHEGQDPTFWCQVLRAVLQTLSSRFPGKAYRCTINLHDEFTPFRTCLITYLLPIPIVTSMLALEWSVLSYWQSGVVIGDSLYDTNPQEEMIYVGTFPYSFLAARGSIHMEVCNRFLRSLDNTESLINKPYHDSYVTWWQMIFISLARRREVADSTQEPLIRFFLLYGADPRIWLRFYPVPITGQSQVHRIVFGFPKMCSKAVSIHVRSISDHILEVAARRGYILH